jgi:hypothetical protein
MRTKLRRWIQRLLKGLEQPAIQSLTTDRLIQTYLENDRIPWSPGYIEHRTKCLARTLEDEVFLQRFRESDELPSGYGYRMDERVVEYPWVLSRSLDWGLRILDAGSTLNNPLLLNHSSLNEKELFIYSLAHDYMERRPRVSYISGDLRETILRDQIIDVVVCISTLEHIGLDNTFLYTQDQRYQENGPLDYKAVLAEFRRILKPRGRLLITVPFGKALQLQWLQQFNRQGIEKIISEFGGKVLALSYFKYDPSGWVHSTAAECGECEYFDIHAKGKCDSDYAAAARAVACIDLERMD